MFYITNIHGLSEHFTTTLGKNNKNRKENKSYDFKTVCLRGLCKEQVLLLIKKMHLNVHFVFRSHLVYSLLWHFQERKQKLLLLSRPEIMIKYSTALPIHIHKWTMYLKVFYDKLKSSVFISKYYAFKYFSEKEVFRNTCLTNSA